MAGQEVADGLSQRAGALPMNQPYAGQAREERVVQVLLAPIASLVRRLAEQQELGPDGADRRVRTARRPSRDLDSAHAPLGTLERACWSRGAPAPLPPRLGPRRGGTKGRDRHADGDGAGADRRRASGDLDQLSADTQMLGGD